MQPSMDFNQSPLVAIWETTRACDLACVHCRASANAAADPHELTTAEAEQLLEQLRELRPGVLVLTGGDPLKRADLLPLIRQAIAGGLSVAITPSVTPLLTQGAIEGLAKAGVSRIALSLDGPDSGAHDTFRGMPGAFAATLDAVRHVRAAGLPLQINTSLSSSTFHHLAALGELVAEIEPVLWSVFFVVPVGRAKQAQQLSADDCESTFYYLYDWSLAHGLAAKTTAAQAYRRVVLQRETERTRAGGTRRPHPPAVNDGKGFVFVSHTGDVYPSGFLPITVGDVLNQSVASLYRDHPFLQALRDPDRLEGKCGRCAFRSACGGSRARAYALTGNPFAEDPSCVFQPPTTQRSSVTAR